MEKMEPIIKRVLENPKPTELINYCNTKHEFFEIFPADEYDFSNKGFTKYFYFDRTEAEIFLNDFLKFVVRNYKINMFRAEKYYSVVDAFGKYLAKNNVFYYNRTMVGISMSVKNNLALYKILKALNPTICVNDETKPAVFSFGEVDEDEPYALDFFNYAEEKLDGYNVSNKYIIEPLVSADINLLKGVFKGVKHVGELPFFINPNYRNIKQSRNKILSLIDSDIKKAWCISTMQDKSIVAFVCITTGDKQHDLNIICESEYYDLEFNKVLQFIANYSFDNLGVQKLVCFNDNVELAYSTINSSLTVAGFKPDYLQETGEGGYSKINYILKKSDYEFKKLETNKSLIIFNF